MLIKIPLSVYGKYVWVPPPHLTPSPSSPWQECWDPKQGVCECEGEGGRGKGGGRERERGLMIMWRDTSNPSPSPSPHPTQLILSALLPTKFVSVPYLGTSTMSALVVLSLANTVLWYHDFLHTVKVDVQIDT